MSALPSVHPSDPGHFIYLNQTKELQRPELDIGDYSYGGLTIRFLSHGARLKIGKYCSLAARLEIFLGGEHDPTCVSNYPFGDVLSKWPKGIPIAKRTKGNVVIGNDVWTGTDATVLSGVTIGDGAVIGTQSVVAKSVPPYEIWAGNPARFIRKRFDDDVIEALLRIQWWNWPDEKVREHADLLSGHNIRAFIEKFDR